MLVRSKCSSVERRQAIRLTWGSELVGGVVFIVDCCTSFSGKAGRLPEHGQPRPDVLAPPASERTQPWVRAGYQWGLSQSVAKWLLTADDSAFVWPSALLTYLQHLARRQMLQEAEVLTCASCVWTPWNASTGLVTRALAEAFVVASRNTIGRMAWAQYHDSMMRWKGVRSRVPEPQMEINAARGDGGRPIAIRVRRRTSLRFLRRGSCSILRDGHGPLVLGTVAGAQTLPKLEHYCRALQQPSILGGTISAPRYLPHTHRHIPLFATNPSLVNDDVYLIRLTAYSSCGRYSMPHLRKFDYARNSIVAVLAKHRLAPLLHFTHAEDARALRVSASRLWIVYNSWNAVEGPLAANQMNLRRYRWPSLEPIAAPVVLVYAAARRREKNWIPFVVPHNGSGQSRVLFTYQLEPHVVLACRPTDGQCRMLHTTPARALWERRIQHLPSHSRPGTWSSMRIPISTGTPCVSLAGAPTCMAHLWVLQDGHRIYLHLWYALSPEPPFEVRRVSRPFRFAPHFKDPRDNIQYAAGLVSSEDGARVTISFGVGDCLAAELSVPSADVLRLLDGDADVSVMSRSAAAMPSPLNLSYSSSQHRSASFL